MLKVLINEVRYNYKTIVYILIIGLVASLLVDNNLTFSNNRSNDDMMVMWLVLAPIFSKKNNNSFIYQAIPERKINFAILRLLNPIISCILYYIGYYAVRFSMGAQVSGEIFMRSVFYFTALFFVLIMYYIFIDLIRTLKSKFLSISIGSAIGIISIAIFILILIYGLEDNRYLNISYLPSIISLVVISLFTYMKRKSYID